MNEYEIILEALQYQVDCGELTLEEAELVNERAYDRYVSEGNAYNRLVNKRYKEYKDIRNEMDKLEINNKSLENLKHNYDKDSKQYKNIQNRINNNEDKIVDLRHDAYRNPKFNEFYNHYAFNNAHVKDIKRLQNHTFNTHFDDDNRNAMKENKKRWMKDHGDAGQRPEEKYKANRYLDAQKERK